MEHTAFCDLILKRKPSGTEAEYLPKAKARGSVEVKISNEGMISEELKVQLEKGTAGNNENENFEFMQSKRYDCPPELIDSKEKSQELKVCIEETCVDNQEIKNSQGELNIQNKGKLDLVDDILIHRKIEQNEKTFENIAEEESGNSLNPEQVFNDSGKREDLNLLKTAEKSKIDEGETGIKPEILNQVEKGYECNESEKFYTPLERTPESIYADCVSGNQTGNEDLKISTEQADESHSSHSTEMLTDVQSTQDPRSDSSGLTDVLDEI